MKQAILYLSLSLKKTRKQVFLEPVQPLDGAQQINECWGMSATENQASAVKKAKSTQLDKRNNRNSGIFVKSQNPKSTA